MFILLGILAGICLPIQTSINANLKKKMGSPYNASLISFGVALIFLLGLLAITERGIYIPFQTLFQQPLWIFGGGICGAIFVTGNILLFLKLGSVQTVVLPILGQIIMGLIIDNFGLFQAEQSNITVLKVIGAACVIVGVIIISLAKQIKTASLEVEISEISTDTQNIVSNIKKDSIQLWVWRIFGVGIGVLSATQVAINGHLGRVVGSSIKGALISFIVGTLLLLIVCLVLKITHPSPQKVEKTAHKNPWWIWLGGIVGGFSILLNVYLSGNIGTGMTVILIVIGATTGGLLVDQFGMFYSDKKPMNLMKIAGIVIMITGACMIKLF